MEVIPITQISGWDELGRHSFMACGTETHHQAVGRFALSSESLGEFRSLERLAKFEKDGKREEQLRLARQCR